MNESTTYLVDTNVFVYAYIGEDLAKYEQANQVLHQIEAGRVGHVSTQVLNELFSRLTRGTQRPAVTADAEETVTTLALRWTVLDTTLETVIEAIRGVRRYWFSYWDSLIWAAARLNGIPYVITEDFSHRQQIEGVTFLNPFADDFVLEGQTV